MVKPLTFVTCQCLLLTAEVLKWLGTISPIRFQPTTIRLCCNRLHGRIFVCIYLFIIILLLIYLNRNADRYLLVTGRT